MKLIPSVLILLFGASFYEVPFNATVLSYDHVQRVGGINERKEDTPNGKVWRGDSFITLQENTWEIPNCIGTGFYLKVQFSNVPEDLKEVMLQIEFPPMQLPDGTIKSRVERFQELDAYGDKAYFEYSYYFDEEYETNLGFWKFDLFHEGKLIYEAQFEVIECLE